MPGNWNESPVELDVEGPPPRNISCTTIIEMMLDCELVGTDYEETNKTQEMYSMSIVHPQHVYEFQSTRHATP